MKVLNLYACLGGNRYKWDEVVDNLEVTAVELDPEAARLYQERFPNDIVIVADAHQYLLDHYKEFDFIWSSPPCPTHSRFQTSMKTIRKMQYPDMQLWKVGLWAKVSAKHAKTLNLKEHRKKFEDADSKEHLAILTSRAFKKAKQVAENAARGSFPSSKPVRLPNYDFEDIYARLRAHYKTLPVNRVIESKVA